jgi:parallel beta-helix repeat protein
MGEKARSVAIISVILLSGLAGIFVYTPEPVSAYTPHDPIFIEGDENFTSANGVTGGNGTKADPYIIEGWSISNTSNELINGIEVRNTSAHFIIGNVSIELFWGAGIELNNVTNCTIYNVNIFGSPTYYVEGISASYCKDLKIINVYTDVDDGGQIILGSVRNCVVEKSNISSTLFLGSCVNVSAINNDIEIDYYVMVWECKEITIVSNNFTNGDRIDIRNTENLTFHNNSLTKNVKYGIDIYTTKNSFFTNNTVNSTALCFWLEYSDNNHFENNLLSSPTNAIAFRYSSYNSIVKNNFKGGGLSCFQSTNNNINGNVMDGTSNGIGFGTSSNNYISNNTITNITDYAIELRTSSNDNVISKNYISDNSDGIQLENSDGNIIHDNQIKNSDLGIDILPICKNLEIINNTIRNNNYGIKVEGNMVGSSSNLTINGNDIFFNSNRGVFLDYASKSQISNNNIKYNEVGIGFFATSHSFVSDNNLSFNEDAVTLTYYSSYNTIKNNSIFENTNIGIVISDTHYSTVSNNSFIRNNISGIKFYRANNNVIENNTVSYCNNEAIEFYESENNYICNNTVFGNGDNGFEIQFSENNFIINNTIFSNNYDGIQLNDFYESTIKDNRIYSNKHRGIYIGSSGFIEIFHNEFSDNDYGIYLSNSNYNKIYQNNFFNNTDQANGGKELNVWNEEYPYGGNYWSDYTGDDGLCGAGQNFSGADGIGDVPYSFSYSTKDNYPLMEPFQYRSASGPSGPQANVGIGYVNLSWDLPVITNGLKITNYIIYKGIKYDQLYRIDEIGNELFYNDTDVEPGEIYRYKVIARTEVDLSFPSRILEIVTVGKPGSPYLINITANKFSIVLEWTKPSWTGSNYGEIPIKNYRVYRCSNIDFKYDLLAELGNVNTYNDTDVELGIQYYYNITAVNAVGEGQPGFAFARIPEPPSMPTNLTAEPNGNGLYLTWNMPEDDGGSQVIKFRIYRSMETGIEEFHLDLDNYNVNGYTDYDVTAGITYYYRISASNRFYESDLSNEASALIQTFPGAPINVIAKNAPRSIRLSWSPPLSDGGSEIINYTIYKGTRSNKIDFYKVIEDVHFYNDDDVIDKVTYYYKIGAVNNLGEGPPSEKVWTIAELMPNKIPTVSISASNLSGKAPLTVEFNGTGSDTDGFIVSYYWNFDDGNTSSEQNPTYIFAREGTYYVKLIAVDNEDGVAIAMITIVVEPEISQPPTVEEDEKEKDGSSAWFIAPIAGIFICIIILILLLFLWLKTKEDEPQVTERVRILREPIAYRRLRRKKSVADEDFNEQELEE